MGLTRAIMTTLWLATGLAGMIRHLKRNRATDLIFDISFLVSYMAASLAALKCVLEH